MATNQNKHRGSPSQDMSNRASQQIIKVKTVTRIPGSEMNSQVIVDQARNDQPIYQGPTIVSQQLIPSQNSAVFVTAPITNSPIVQLDAYEQQQQLNSQQQSTNIQTPQYYHQPTQQIYQTKIISQEPLINTTSYQIPVQNNQFYIQNQSTPPKVNNKQYFSPKTYQNQIISSPNQIQPMYQNEQIYMQDNQIYYQNGQYIQYVPYLREVEEMETQEIVEYVPKYKVYTDYIAVEKTIDYQPQVVQETKIEYVPVETVEQKVYYYPVEKTTIISQPQFIQEVQKIKLLNIFLDLLEFNIQLIAYF